MSEPCTNLFPQTLSCLFNSLRMHRTTVTLTRVAAIRGAPARNFWINFLNKYSSLCPGGSQPPSLLRLSVHPFIYPNWFFPTNSCISQRPVSWNYKWGWDHLYSGSLSLTYLQSVWVYSHLVTYENAILTKELHLRLEILFQPGPQLGKEEQNMLLTLILVRLSSNISWPISAPTLPIPVYEGADWALLKAAEKLQNCHWNLHLPKLTAPYRGKDHSDIITCARSPADK